METHTDNRRSTHTGRSTDGKRGTYTYWSKDERKEARTQSFPFRLFYSLYGLSFVSFPLLFLLYSSFPLSTSGSVSPSISLHLHSYPALRSSGSLLTLLCSFSSASSPSCPFFHIHSPFPPCCPGVPSRLVFAHWLGNTLLAMFFSLCFPWRHFSCFSFICSFQYMFQYLAPISFLSPLCSLYSSLFLSARAGSSLFSCRFVEFTSLHEFFFFFFDLSWLV